MADVVDDDAPAHDLIQFAVLPGIMETRSQRKSALSSEATTRGQRLGAAISAARRGSGKLALPMNLLSLRGLPVFGAFFFWAFGTGAMQLARPLFAASFGVPLVLVALVISSNAFAHILAGPLTGFAMDRWGRRPLLLLGVSLRGLSAVLEFFAGSYQEFLLLEFLGGIGVAMWVTGASVLVADLTVVQNRGRVVAARNGSSRIGFIAGPLVGAAIAAALDLRWIFLFNAATKVAILAIVLIAIRETRPEPAPLAPGAPTAAAELSLSTFVSRPFLVIAAVSFCLTAMSQGVFQSLFPVYLTSTAGFSASDVGTFITIASVAMLAISVPNGYAVDVYGRKATLVPGLLVLGGAAYLLTTVGDQASALLMVLAYGIGEGVCFGSSQAYAMDLAPEHRRGAFLGIWSVVSNSGGALAPLLVGMLAQQFGYFTAFVAVAATLVAVALTMALFGPDTRSGRQFDPVAAAAPGTSLSRRSGRG